MFMETEVLRHRLLEYIHAAEDRKIQAIYTILEEEIEQPYYDQETINNFHQRRDSHLNGITPSYTIEEALNLVRNQKK